MHAELVGELSTNSSKEMAIEQSLAGIAAAWTDLTLDMVPYKETHKGVYKLRGTEDVFAALEVGMTSGYRQIVNVESYSSKLRIRQSGFKLGASRSYWKKVDSKGEGLKSPRQQIG